MTKQILKVLLVTLCLLVSLYPIKYFFGPINVGLLATKPAELLASYSWNAGFYGHITFGGLALLVGWVQFNKRLRNKYLKIHRIIGVIYCVAVLISSICGIFIAFYATGGFLTKLGFILLGLVWLCSTVYGFVSIRRGRLLEHQKFMLYSYSTCFAAVTLRLWLPILLMFIEDFIIAYTMVAWLCWVPNLVIAYLLNKRMLNQ
jgi:uncharacterized membrane protein